MIHKFLFWIKLLFFWIFKKVLQKKPKMKSLDFALRSQHVMDCLPPLFPDVLKHLVDSYCAFDVVPSYCYKLRPSYHIVLGVIADDIYWREVCYMSDDCPYQHYLMRNTQSTNILLTSHPRAIQKLDVDWFCLPDVPCTQVWNRRTARVMNFNNLACVCVHKDEVFYTTIYSKELWKWSAKTCRHIKFQDIKNVVKMKSLGDHLMLEFQDQTVQLLGQSFDARLCSAMYAWQNQCYVVVNDRFITPQKTFTFPRIIINVFAFDYLVVLCSFDTIRVCDLRTLTIYETNTIESFQLASKDRLVRTLSQEIQVFE